MNILAILLVGLVNVVEISDTTRKCGSVSNITSFLTGRGIRSPVDVPWHVSITRRNELYPDVTVPGLLISPSLVLTRAYYFNERDTEKYIIFPFGDYRVAVGTRNFGDPVTHIRIHPRYKIGRWTTAQNDFALIHLSKNVTISPFVEPICLPRSWDYVAIKDLRTPATNSATSELSLTGWNRQNPVNIFLRLKIQTEAKCEMLWNAENETYPVPFNESRTWCAQVGSKEENNHTTCIHNNVGAVAAVRLLNGSYFLSGIVRELYSSNRERRCEPGALYYFDVIPADTFTWIEDNMKCGAQNFTCSNGQCISLSGSKLCNQKNDCDDGSDEEPGFCRGFSGNFCEGDTFPCGVYGACIPKEEVCNGRVDCEGGGEDERDCPYENNIARNISLSISVALLILILAGMVVWRLQLRKLKNEIRNLTKKEVQDFKRGVKPPDIKQRAKDVECSAEASDTIDNYYMNDPIQSLPWKKEYEISLKSLNIGPEINRGRFGIVYKAIWIQNNNKNPEYTEVAVKTHIKSVRVTEFKALLCELKIQSYLGINDYVLKFLGACTKDIKKREVYMVVEYCLNGNLRDFLSENGKYYVNRQIINEIRPSPFDGYVLDYSQFGFIDNFDLLLWSTQISCGMEFLSSQNIIHADLACRNLLLTDALNIKISDFGLSKKFGGSGIYIKSTNEPIAWKWLAAETFKTQIYSEKTDVWGFGVVLYEIYSLCQEEPYPGIGFTEQFVNDLTAGKRLPKPVHATDEIYKLMSFCWNLRPEDRPRFTALKSNLTILLQQFQAERYTRRLSDDLKVSVGEYVQLV